MLRGTFERAVATGRRSWAGFAGVMGSPSTRSHNEMHDDQIAERSETSPVASDSNQAAMLLQPGDEVEVLDTFEGDYHTLVKGSFGVVGELSEDGDADIDFFFNGRSGKQFSEYVKKDELCMLKKVGASTSSADSMSDSEAIIGDGSCSEHAEPSPNTPESRKENSSGCDQDGIDEHAAASDVDSIEADDEAHLLDPNCNQHADPPPKTPVSGQDASGGCDEGGLGEHGDAHNAKTKAGIWTELIRKLTRKLELGGCDQDGLGEQDDADVAEKQNASNAAADTVRRGVIVRLRGLQSTPHLNGKLGLCLYAGKEDRWAVHLDCEEPGCFRNVRERNLEPVCCGGAAQPSVPQQHLPAPEASGAASTEHENFEMAQGAPPECSPAVADKRKHVSEVAEDDTSLADQFAELEREHDCQSSSKKRMLSKDPEEYPTKQGADVLVEDILKAPQAKVLRRLLSASTDDLAKVCTPEATAYVVLARSFRIRSSGA